MSQFNSYAPIKQLAQLGNTPSNRLLGLFDALRDAPNEVGMASSVAENAALLDFCTQQAAALGAAQPRILAEHILLIAINADRQTDPQTRLACLTHGQKAAHALILAQTQTKPLSQNWLTVRPFFTNLSASALLVFTVGVVLTVASQQSLQRTASSKLLESNLTENDTSQLYAKYEQMRQGTCQYPEALQIPDQDQAVYLENVVAGKLPTNLKDLAIAKRYLEKVRCNFTPMLMANSTSYGGK